VRTNLTSKWHRSQKRASAKRREGDDGEKNRCLYFTCLIWQPVNWVSSIMFVLQSSRQVPPSSLRTQLLLLNLAISFSQLKFNEYLKSLCSYYRIDGIPLSAHFATAHYFDSTLISKLSSLCVYWKSLAFPQSTRYWSRCNVSVSVYSNISI